MRSAESSIRTPLGGVRGLGSAGKGTGDFIVMRVTSVALTILLVAFVAIVIALVGRPYVEAVALLSSPVIAIVLIASVLLTTVHMRIGMQTIVEDYIHSALPKFALLLANWIFCWTVGLTAAFAVLKIASGS